MQKCPICKQRKVHVEEVRDDDGLVTESRTVCKNCGILKLTVTRRKKKK